MGKIICSIAVLYGVCCAQNANAFLFDFATSTRTFLGGPDSPVPDTSDFVNSPGLDQNLFTVGNLTNGCGVFLNQIGSVSRSGTECVDPSDPGHVRNVRFDTGADTFTLTDPVAAELQIIVKLGHPEAGADSALRDQNQREEFILRLVDEMGSSMDLAELLDDVDSDLRDDEKDNGYYLYVYNPSIVPPGTWHPESRGTRGSLEFVVQLNAGVPEPAAFGTFATGLLVMLISRYWGNLNDAPSYEPGFATLRRHPKPEDQ